MNIYLTWVLITGGVLFSICNAIVICILINFLFKMNQVSKKVSRVTTFFNWDARLLAPIFIFKKIISSYLRKYKAKSQLADLEDLLYDEDSCDLDEDSWCKKFFRSTGWITATVVALAIFLRKKD